MKTALAIGALLAISRIWIGVSLEPENASIIGSYQAVAHLFVGGLAVAWWYERLAWQWRLFWGLSALEVAVAIGSRL